MPKVSEAFTGDSSYLKQGDLKGRKVAVTIQKTVREEVGQGDDKETKWVMHFNGADKGLVLNITNANFIAAILGDEMNNWPGHKIVLYADPSIMYQGRMVGGIRVQAYNGPVAAPPPPPPPAEIQEGFSREPGDDDDPFSG